MCSVGLEMDWFQISDGPMFGGSNESGVRSTAMEELVTRFTPVIDRI